jgi:hypothetical protein
MIEQNSNLANFREEIRLNHGNVSGSAYISIAGRLHQLDQMFQLWEMFRDSRIAAGKPGPYDLPPKDIRPISK